jgi:hypothetical protein
MSNYIRKNFREKKIKFARIFNMRKLTKIIRFLDSVIIEM